MSQLDGNEADTAPPHLSIPQLDGGGGGGDGHVSSSSESGEDGPDGGAADGANYIICQFEKVCGV